MATAGDLLDKAKEIVQKHGSSATVAFSVWTSEDVSGIAADLNSELSIKHVDNVLVKAQDRIENGYGIDHDMIILYIEEEEA